MILRQAALDLWDRVRRVWTSDSHSGRRWRAIGLTAGTSVGERVVVSVCSLVQVPIALHYLGIEGFGLWMTLVSVTTMMVVADLGLGSGLQNKLSETYGNDDPIATERWFATGMLMLALIGLIMFLFTLPFCYLVDWGGIFHVQDPQRRAETGQALAILLLSFFVGMPFTAAQRLAASLQVAWIACVKNAIVSVVTLLAVVLAAWSKLGFLAFIWVVVLPPVLGNIILLLILATRFRWKLNFLRLFKWRDAQALLQQNWLFVFPSIGGTILLFAPALIISSMLGAAALTPYNLAQKLLGLFALAQSMILAPLWPAYTEAHTRGDIGWVNATYRKSLHLSFWLVVLPTLSFTLFGRPLLALWTGQPAASFDWLLILSLAVWTAVITFLQPIALLLNSLGKVKGQATYGLLSVLVSLALMPSFVSHFGVAGGPISLIVVFSIINLPLSLWESSWHLHKLNHSATASTTTHGL